MVGHGSLLAQQFICISDMLNVLVHWSAALGYMLIVNNLVNQFLINFKNSNRIMIL